MSLIIDCIFSDNRRDYVKYVNSLEVNYTTIIDHHSISNKLAKSCPYGEEPNPSVIGLHIFKTLESTLIFHTDQKILYLFKNLESLTVSNLKETVNDLYYREFEFNLLVFSENQFGTEITEHFDNVKYLKNDKA
jgi:hypothetical protein